MCKMLDYIIEAELGQSVLCNYFLDILKVILQRHISRPVFYLHQLSAKIASVQNNQTDFRTKSYIDVP